MTLVSTACRISCACLLAAALAACSARPFPVASPKSQEPVLEARQEAAKLAGRPNPWLVSICYSNVLNTPEEVIEEAKLACPNGRAALLDSDMIWTPCGLLQPVRATFLCTPKPENE